MTATILVASVATPGIGLVVDRVAPADAHTDERLSDAGMPKELETLGWLPAEDVFDGARWAAGRVRQASGVRVGVAQRRFELPLSHGPVHCQPASESLVLDALGVLEREMAKYPPDCLHRSGLRHVVLCRDLHEGSMEIPSLPNYRNTLLLDANASVVYLRRIVHHEVFHFIDFASRGDISQDARWASLNPPSFEYGSGGRVMRNVPTAWQRERRGFVTFYAQSALEEDKAEVFSMWMSAAERLQSLAEKDRIIASKTRALREQVIGWCPSLVERLDAPTSH